MRRTDALIARLAAGQHGVVSRRQLQAHGISARAIDHRLARERLHRLHPGIYLVGHAVPPPLARETGALLAGGPAAALSHRTAGRLWGIHPGHPEGLMEITTPSGRRRREGFLVHVVPRLEPDDRCQRDGLTLTAPARTLLDLAGVMSTRALERALDQALVLNLTTGGKIAAALARDPRRRGGGRLQALLDADRLPSPTRSEAEERFLSLVRRAALPTPRVNVRVEGYEVDFFWPADRLVVEVDGRRFHSTRAAFERDRRRDAVLQAAGIGVIRATWRAISDDSHALVVAIGQALVRRSGADAAGRSVV